MDMFCSRCGAPDGTTPENHPCMDNLIAAAKLIINKAMPTQDAIWDDLSIEEIFKVERELSKVYEQMGEVYDFYREAMNKADRGMDVTYQGRKAFQQPLRTARDMIRLRLTDPE